MLLCAGYTAEALATLSFGRLGQPGAALFPVIVAGLLALASTALVVEQLRPAAGGDDAGLELPRGPARRRLLIAAASIAAYIALAPLVGHLLASLALCAPLVAVCKPAAAWRIALTALAIGLSVYVVFVRLLHVALPTGRLFD